MLTFWTSAMSSLSHYPIYFLQCLYDPGFKDDLEKKKKKTLESLELEVLALDSEIPWLQFSLCTFLPVGL